MPGGRPHLTSPSPSDPESEVRANIVARPLSSPHDLGTVADLNLPYDFLTRLADRALRASFYERFRSVACDQPASAPQTTANDVPTPAAPGVGADVRVEHFHLPASAALLWGSLPESLPALASFRSPLSDEPSVAREQLAGNILPETAPGDAITESIRAARRTARKHLARDGLLPALARVIAALGPARLLPPHTDAPAILADAGIPVDLLAFLQPVFVPDAATPAGVVGALASRLAAGESLDKLLKSLRKPGFVPRPSLPNFRPTSDSGQNSIALLRAHATRATRYSAPGDGSNLDLLSAVLTALPTTPAIVNTSEEHAESLKLELERVLRSAPTTILAQPLAVSQWAADNAKPGALNYKPAHLAPRFASRAEYHPTFVPGDDLALSASSSLIHIARSPLLFQGGNLLIIDDLPRRRRVLLLGEAELHRNRALGLSGEQALAFLQLEFGADDAEVLPAASYHIDQEVSIRSTSERTLAFVPDPLAAAVVLIECSLVALAGASRWPLALVEHALAHLRAARLHDALTLIWRALAPERTPELGWPLSLANALSVGPADSGVGNLHRFLLALDHLAADATRASEIPDPNLAALLRSFHRRDRDRARIRTLLSRRGWSIIPIPALPEESRGINTLNGIHTPDSYLMPAYSGLFAPLDQVAFKAFESALGPRVRVVPIPSAESQRREGALHCSLACFP